MLTAEFSTMKTTESSQHAENRVTFTGVVLISYDTEERKCFFLNHKGTHCYGGPSSLVSIATGCGLDGPGIESWWGRDFPHLFRPGLGPTQPPVQWVPGLSRG